MRRGLPAAVLCLALLAATAAAWAAAGIYAYAGRSALVHADAAIVLGAAAWGEQPSPVFRERINHAVDLYKQGYVRKLIFTGGSGAGGGPAEATVARRYAVACGVPEGDILVETRSRITEENLLNAREVAVQEGLASFLIVSDPLHMKRAMLMARDLGMECYPAPTPTTRYRSLGSRLSFLARETVFYLGYLLYRPFIAGA